MEFKTLDGTILDMVQYKMKLDLSGTDEQLESFNRFMSICDLYGFEFEYPLTESEIYNIGKTMFENFTSREKTI